MNYCACGCGKVAPDGKKYVQGHNARWIANRDIRGRLLAKRRMNGECWEFTGQIDKRGYGRISFEGRKQFAHNLAYRLWKGPIPDGMEPDHLCKNRACFNPDHLEAVPQAENARRGRQAKLTHTDVAIIRALDEPHTETARFFGVDESTICDIRNYRRWNYAGRSS